MLVLHCVFTSTWPIVCMTSFRFPVFFSTRVPKSCRPQYKTSFFGRPAFARACRNLSAIVVRCPERARFDVNTHQRDACHSGYRVFVCSNMAFAGDFTPVLAKHSKSFSLIDCISVGVDPMQRNFEPMIRHRSRDFQRPDAER